MSSRPKSSKNITTRLRILVKDVLDFQNFVPARFLSRKVQFWSWISKILKLRALQCNGLWRKRTKNHWEFPKLCFNTTIYGLTLFWSGGQKCPPFLNLAKNQTHFGPKWVCAAFGRIKTYTHPDFDLNFQFDVIIDALNCDLLLFVVKTLHCKLTRLEY